MIQTELSHLPIVIANSNRMGCFRVLHLLISIPLVGLASWSLYWGDMSGLGVLLIAAVISGSCEFIGYLVNRDAVSSRYEIDAKEVNCQHGKDSWCEPLSAYDGIDWLETQPIGEGMIDWRVELRHREAPERSVVLFENGLSGRNLDEDLTTWHNVKEALGLPGERLVGTAFSQLEPKSASKAKNIAPVQVGAGHPEFTEVLVRRSVWIWIVLSIAFLGCAVLLFQQIADRGFGRLFSETGTILSAIVLGFVLILSWAMTSAQVNVKDQEVEIKTTVGPLLIRTQNVKRESLRDVSAIFNNFGAASVHLHREGSGPILLRFIRVGDAQRLKQSLEKVIQDAQLES